jgi:hypothetical protein
LHSTKFKGSAKWEGPSPVNGHLVNNDDPFVMHSLGGLSAAASAFNPI